MQKASTFQFACTQSSSLIYGGKASESAHAAHTVMIERWLRPFTHTLKRSTSQRRPEYDSDCFVQKDLSAFAPPHVT